MITIQEQQREGEVIYKYFGHKIGELRTSIPPEKYPYYWQTICRRLQETLNTIGEEVKRGMKENPEERTKQIDARLKEIINSDSDIRRDFNEISNLLRERASLSSNPTTSP